MPTFSAMAAGDGSVSRQLTPSRRNQRCPRPGSTPWPCRGHELERLILRDGSTAMYTSRCHRSGTGRRQHGRSPSPEVRIRPPGRSRPVPSFAGADAGAAPVAAQDRRRRRTRARTVARGPGPPVEEHAHRALRAVPGRGIYRPSTAGTKLTPPFRGAGRAWRQAGVLTIPGSRSDTSPPRAHTPSRRRRTAALNPD